ncbi:hypothetical protein WJX72_001535 [[Myrmecia] bisecta]|uniref:Pseudouridine-5'-phosphate glycosidase n=1 Tax=[Myrmecia] bisecta TaxID=41462 RepID=A0AAW1PT44_9CHLO
MEPSWRTRIAGLTAHITGSTPGSDASTSYAQEGVVAVSAAVQKALRDGSPVVALESTIISHGMPFPQNLQTARDVEAVIRANGATPATIAVLGGVPTVGLTDVQLHSLAQKGLEVRKTSRRDLPYVMAHKLDGSTTVSATMLLAARAGIRVFVTGGIGGVHRGGESTMDISADLTELGRTPVVVVCAGPKSLLDIPRTLEYLETQGVCVASYGTNEFPAFFTPRSGCMAPARVDSPGEAAAMIRGSLQLGLGSGMVIGVPIPSQFVPAGARIEKAIQTALKEATSKGISGNDLTPFLLDRIRDLTGGASLTANIHLIKNNASVGARIAVALSKLR